MAQQTALITGASSGIGRELAKVFAEEGHNVVLVARRQQRLQQLAAEIMSTYGTRTTVIARDLIAAGSAEQLFEHLEQRDIAIDILVNNAGVVHTELFADAPLEQHLQLLQLNVIALTRLTHLFLQPMRRRGYGRILNVASIAGFFPTPSFALYGASKAFVVSLTEGLAVELKGSGVTVTALCPGFTRTEMLDKAEGLERYLPRFSLLDAETVAREGYRACMAGRTLHIDSVSNRMFVQWVRLQPKFLVRNVGGWMARLAQTLRQNDGDDA